VTPEDVRRAADTYLRPERLTLAVLRSKGEASAAQETPSKVADVSLAVAQDPNVVFKVWVKAGSQADPAGKEGLAHLTAAMLEEGGTKRLTTEQLAAKLFPLAASISGSVDKEMTVFTGQSHRDVAPQFYPLFAEALTEPGFRPEDFERLKARTLSEIEKELRFSSDEELGKAALTGMVFEGTPYAHLVQGTVAGLKSITLEDVRAFWKARYTRDNVVTAIGGAYDAALAQRLASDAARLPEATAATAPAPKSVKPAGRRVLIVEKPGQSTAISFGTPIDLHRGSREFYALWVATSWLGEHRNSSAQLYKVIRGARGMNYGDYAYIEAFPRGGQLMLPPTGVGRRSQMFEVWVRPVPDDRAVFALRAALREVERLAKNGMSKVEFEARKAFLKKYSYQFARTTAERLGYALDDRFYGLGGEGHLARFRKAMDDLTLEETNAAIRKYFTTDSLSIALVTAKGEALKKALVEGAPSPISYGKSEKPAAVLEEDKEIASWPLRLEAKDVTVVPVGRMFEK
jgi:zinc protease